MVFWQHFLYELKVFARLKTDEQRFKYVLQSRNIEAQINKWRSSLEIHESKKCLNSASNIKQEANKAYACHRDNRAVDLYNQGLCFCSENEAAVFYGNRSAALFSLSRWSECLMDLECALNAGYPREKKWKLLKRKACVLGELKRSRLQCLQECLACIPSFMEGEILKLKELLSLERDFNREEEAIDHSDEIQVVNGFGKVLLNASKSLIMGRDATHGRFLYANEFMKQGSIIICEKPFAAVLLPPYYKTHCHHCFGVVKLVYPCYNCTEVLYCSPACAQLSWKSYHRFECLNLCLLESVGIAHLALRVLLVANTRGELERYAMRKENATNDVYDCDYDSVYNLMANSEHMPVEDLFQYSVTSALLYKLLDDNFFGEGATDSYRLTCGALLLRHIQQLIGNAHAVTHLETHDATDGPIMEQDQVRIATAIYPTTSLLNHSCQPTILNNFKNDRLIVKLSKDVNVGEQIFNCYGPHYRRMGLEERQRTLKQQYFFTCRCPPCLDEGRATNLNALICLSCAETVTSGRCDECGMRVDLVEYERNSEFATELFANSVDLLSTSNSRETTTKALEKLKLCLKLRERMFSRHHAQISTTHDVIAKCYVMLGDYEKAHEYLRNSVSIVQTQYGETSIEYTNEMLKLADISMNCADHQDALCVVERAIELVKLNKEPDGEDLKDLQMKCEILRQMCPSVSTFL